MVFEAKPVLIGQPFGAFVVEHDVGVPVRGVLIPRVPASSFLKLPAKALGDLRFLYLAANTAAPATAVAFSSAAVAVGCREPPQKHS